MEDAAVLSRAALKVLTAFNASKSDGQCTRGCTLSDKIHWWGAGIGDAGCRAFGRILEAKAGTSKRSGPVAALHNLLLGRNELGDDCIDVLVGLAARGFFQNLRALGLSRNKIRDHGCRALGQSIAAGGFPNLRDLYLSANEDLTDACFETLGRSLATPLAPRSFERFSAGDLPLIGASGLIALLEPLRADANATSGYRGAPKLREVSLRNMSAICADESRRTRLLAAIGGLTSESDRRSHLGGLTSESSPSPTLIGGLTSESDRRSHLGGLTSESSPSPTLNAMSERRSVRSEPRRASRQRRLQKWQEHIHAQAQRPWQRRVVLVLGAVGRTSTTAESCKGVVLHDPAWVRAQARWSRSGGVSVSVK